MPSREGHSEMEEELLITAAVVGLRANNWTLASLSVTWQGNLSHDRQAALPLYSEITQIWVQTLALT